MRLARQRILPLSLILVMILTVVSCVRNTYLTKFDSVAEYWSSTVNPDLDPSKIAHLMIPFVNSNGIHFLLLKMEAGSEQDQQTALLCLGPIYSVLNDAGNNSNNAARVLKHEIDQSSFRQKLVEWSQGGKNVAIRRYLSCCADTLTVGRVGSTLKK